MNIFKLKKAKYEEKKVVGAYIPLDLVEFVQLTSLHTCDSISSIVQKKLEEFKIQNLKNGIDLDYLIQQIGCRAYTEYSCQKELSLNKFKSKLKVELNKKNISEGCINKIIQILDEKESQ